MPSGGIPTELFAWRFALKHNILRQLVVTKAEIDGMAHFAGAGPLCELHLRHKLRLDPRRDGFIFYFLTEGRLRSFQLNEFAVQLFKRLVAETRADMPDIAPAVAVPKRERQRAEERSRFPWSREARDNNLLTF